MDTGFVMFMPKSLKPYPTIHPFKNKQSFKGWMDKGVNIYIYISYVDR